MDHPHQPTSESSAAAKQALQAELADLAVLQTLQQGAGALWVDAQSKEKPTYLRADQLQPAAFREMFQKTWKEDNQSSAFLVLKDQGQLHLVKVPLRNAHASGTV